MVGGSSRRGSSMYTTLIGCSACCIGWDMRRFGLTLEGRCTGSIRPSCRISDRAAGRGRAAVDLFIYMSQLSNALPRRRFLQVLTAGAVSVALPATPGAKALRGIFPIAQSPFTEADKLDLDCLADQVRFL